LDSKILKFSIVICNYNYETYLNEAITSAYNQTYENKEVIIIDDGSTDNSRQVIEKWKDKVRVIYKQNGGQISAYNVGFEEAVGDFIIFLDADDTLDANLLNKLIHFFDDDDVVKVHYKMRLIDSNGHSLGPSIPRYLSDGDMAKPLLDKGWFYFSSPGTGNVYRRESLKPFFPIPIIKNDSHGADFFCIYSVMFKGKIKTLNESLAGYRVHAKENQDSPRLSLSFGNASKKYDEALRYQNRIEIYKKWLFERTSGKINIKHIQLDFSNVKNFYCKHIFEQDNYLNGLVSGAKYLGQLFNSINARQNYPFYKKLALLVWALSILILPRKIGFKLARIVTNPASRS